VLNDYIYGVGRKGTINWWPRWADYKPFVVKYSLGLAHQWPTVAPETGEFAAVTALDGYLYAVGITGTYLDPPVGRQLLIEKYDQSGSRQWRSTSGGLGENMLQGVVAVGDRLFAVGYTRSEGAGGADVLILEIDPDTGDVLNTTLWGGAHDDLAYGAATDGADLYVVGTSNSFASDEGNVVGQNEIMLIHYRLNRAPVELTVSSSENPSTYGTSVTFTAVVSPATATGTVTVKDGSTTIDTCMLSSGSCTISTSTLSAGPHTITAVYGGDATYPAGTSDPLTQTVNQATSSVTVTCPTSAQPYTGSAQTPCTASYSTSDGLSGPLTVSYSNNSNVGTAGASASYAGDVNHAGSNNTGSFTISKATSSVTVTCPTTAQPYTGLAQTPCSATVVGAGELSQSLEVSYTNNTNVGTAGASASYAGDTNHTGSSNTGTFTISKAPTSILYTGSQYVVVGSTLKLSSELTAPAGCTGAITYSLDRDPLTGVSGAHPLSGTLVPATNWLEGAYGITVTYAGGLNCMSSFDDTGTLAVATAGDSASGGGWYTLNGRVNFGFVVQQVPKTTPIQYKGQIVLIQKGKWRLKGTLTQYGKSSNGIGTATGSGSLYWWNSALNGGLGDWQLASTNVTFTIQFTATTAKKSNPGTFGIMINYMPTGAQPQLPNSIPQLLKGGVINLK
jgi:hypothetical protein